MAILSPQDILLLLLCVALHLIYRNRRKALLPYPPGPPRLPLLGNALSIPLQSNHVLYKELGERLGSKIIYLEALGRKMVVLNDAQYAKDLLDKRSALYSSRPRMIMISEVAQLGFLFATMPYGNEWRNHRRLFQQYFSPKLLARDQERGLEFVRKMLLPNLYQSPHNIHEHIQNCVGGFATAITYGVPVRRANDPILQLAEEAFEQRRRAAMPGKYLVDLIPILRHVPEWMPGANFQVFARECRTAAQRVREVAHQATLKAMEDGTTRESFVSNSLEQYGDRSDSGYQAQCIEQTAAQVHGAATQTTVAACLTFLLAMLKHPSIQRSAQREIDSVIGHDRLPDFSDKAHLPYLSAILKEVLRWNPIVPLGIPHYTTKEDVYKGYYIPKGCVVIANAYAMLQDEEIYPDPKEFKPERFFTNGGTSPDIPDPEEFATFGFGRRICPGSHIALSTLYIIAASTLALFDISPALDAEGNPIDVGLEWPTGSLLSEPQPFQCRLLPRKGKDVENLLREYMDVEFV